MADSHQQALETPYDLVAVLFHRPSPSSTDSNGITSSRITTFLDTLSQVLSSQPTSSSPTPLDNPNHPHVLSITVSNVSASLPTIRTSSVLLDFEKKNDLEIVYQASQTYKTPVKLAVFDMDSTLIQQEVIDELAAVAGVEELVSNITARAMNGELDFSASLRERVGLLAGLPETVFEELKPRITLTPGAATLLKVLKKSGVKTALLSGGFVPLARWVAGTLGIDHVHANELAVGEDGKLTGKLAPDCVIVDGARKKALLGQIAAQEGITDSRAIVAVGDGANDLPMLWAAGLGVAVNAKPKVQRDAPARLNGKTALLDVMYCVGIPGGELNGLTSP